MRRLGLKVIVTLVVCAAHAAAHAAQNVVVILDDSGSMGERMRSQRDMTRMEAAKQALTTVLERLPEDAHVGVVMLNTRNANGDRWVVPLGPVDINSARVAINRVQPEGGTPLGAFLKFGADALLEKRAAEHYGTFRLLVVTDGEANDASDLESYLPDVLSRGIVVDAIGVDMASDHSLATKVHSYRRADDAESLTTAVQEVFAETTGGQDDAGVDDFELLQALPDEVATAALTALSESGNQPIGGVELPQQGRERPSTNRGGSSGSNKKSGRNSFAWIIMLVVLYAGISIVRSALRQRR